MVGIISNLMPGRTPTKEAPTFGKRLAGLRKSRGLTQKELADLLNTTRGMVDYYERRAVNPAIEVIKRAAEVFDVSPAELIGGDHRTVKSARQKPGPQSALDRRVEEIRRLPRKHQQFVLQLLDTVIENARKAS